MSISSNMEYGIWSMEHGIWNKEYGTWKWSKFNECMAEGVYIGSTVDDLQTGEGLFIWSDSGDYYFGDWNKGYFGKEISLFDKNQNFKKKFINGEEVK